MIKIEKISATKATIIRGGLRQPLILHSHISAEELATIEAETGTIVYSVDEAEIKELVFQAKPAPVPPAPKQPRSAATKPAAKIAEPEPQPTNQENAPE